MDIAELTSDNRDAAEWPTVTATIAATITETITLALIGHA